MGESDVRGTGAGDGVSYRDAGVDIDAASGALSRLRTRIESTFPGTGAAAPIGHFGGFYQMPGTDRLLVASADGVGTKIKLAFVLGGEAHSRVGADLVNHCVNDILACGARPHFFLDYVAMGRMDEEVFAGVVGGMADACRENGVALIGGESAEMPGLYAEGEYDLGGFIVGEVEANRVIDGRAIAAGDRLVGLPSGGLQTNGFSLARAALGLTGDREHDRGVLAQPLPGGDGETYGEALMAPHASFVPSIRPLIDAGVPHGMAHITGGGIVDNVPRMLPDGLAVEIDPSTWAVPPIFDALADAAEIERGELFRAFNMGIGFVVAVDPSDVEAARGALPGAVEIGFVVQSSTEEKRVYGLD